MDREKCIEKELNLVTTYDQYIDVVSCWEAFLTFSYSLEYEEFFFDRFPKITVSDKVLRPDFTAFFTEEYGMIFEISRTFPRDDKGLNKEMSQLFEYDGNIPIYNGKEFQEVDNYDIILLLSGIDAHEITHRISTYLKDTRTFDHNFIIMDYNFGYVDTNPLYYFRKIPLLESRFTDFFPDHKSISKQVDENHKSIKVKINYMKEYKINGVLCNDDPPPAYLAGYIWHKILYSYLNENQKQLWREKNPRLVMPIQIDIEDLRLRVEKSIKNGRIRKPWIKNVLQFFIECDLAEKKSDDTYEIGYRNVYPVLKTEYSDEFLLEKEHMKELAKIFIERFCEKRYRIHEKGKKDKKQVTLDGLDILLKQEE